MDHLLHHCSYAYSLWTLVFCTYGVFWLMPKQVVELLDSWNKGVGWHQTELFIYLFRRGAILLGITCTIWRKQNHRTLKGDEHSILELKRFFLLSLS